MPKNTLSEEKKTFTNQWLKNQKKNIKAPDHFCGKNCTGIEQIVLKRCFLESKYLVNNSAKFKAN